MGARMLAKGDSEIVGVITNYPNREEKFALQDPFVSEMIAALENARRVFELSEVECDIIRKHMFPLTPVPPRYREGWLVVLADKVCSVYEFFRKDAYRGIKIRYFSH